MTAAGVAISPIKEFRREREPVSSLVVKRRILAAIGDGWS
jgi:hypothetical protein